MKILFDYQTFEEQKIGGISRYFHELISHFKNSDGVNPELSIKYTSNEYLKNAPHFKNQILGDYNFYNEFLYGINFKGKGKLLHLKNKLTGNDKINANKKLSIECIKKGHFDLFHPTDYNSYYLDYIGNKPFVVTAYDMIHEIFPEHLSLNSPVSKNKKKIFEKASKIIAISENTKRDIVTIFNINENKIDVVYLANSLNKETFAGKQVELNNLPNNYLLFVGSRLTYKNFYFFITSIVPLLEKDPALHVVCTGIPFNKNELAFFHRLGIEKQLHQYYVNDVQLAYLYNHALAFIFPSLYEGFGIPVLEAFACECPALLSNTSSLPEIGGDAAAYFEPKDALSIRNAIASVIYNNDKRKQLIEKGIEQHKKFSWELTAKKTLEVYKKVIKN